MIRNQGLHTDNHFQDQPEGTYRDARNISVIEDINSITNNSGTSLFAQLPKGYIIVGIQSVSNNRIVVFLSNSSNSIIGLIDNNGNYSELLTSSDLNLSVSAPISTTYKSVIEPVDIGDGQDILSVPLNVEAFDETSSSFKVTWDEIEDAEEYEIRITYEDSDSTLQTNIEPANETEFVGLDSGTVYDIYVKAKATGHLDSGEGFGQGGTKFEELQLSNENILATGFLATWNNVNADRYEFNIYSPNDELLENRLSIKDVQYNVTGLPAEFYGQQHLWTITAHSNNPIVPSTTGQHTFIGQPTVFSSDISGIINIAGDTQVETFLADVDEPENLTNTNEKALGFTANWDEVTVPEGYDIDYYEFELYDESNNSVRSALVSSTSYDVSGLDDNKYGEQYQWRVKAVTQGGVESDWSAWKSFTGEATHEITGNGTINISGETTIEIIN